MLATGRLLEEGPQLVREAEQRGLTARLIGGVAIRTLLGHRFDAAFARPLHDIDLFTRRRDSRKLEGLIKGRGWQPSREFNALNGNRRLLFNDPHSEARRETGSTSARPESQTPPRTTPNTASPGNTPSGSSPSGSSAQLPPRVWQRTP
jgi:hypothetical protein